MQHLRVVEPNASDHRRAIECARARNARSRTFNPGGDDGIGIDRHINLHSVDTALFYDLIGALGEIAFARRAGTIAPLHVDTFHSRADVPPNWDVKTQLSTSKDTLRSEMRLRPRDWHPGRRYVFVEAAPTLRGDWLFIVHGWIGDPAAREVAIRRYANSPNRFIHLRHLQPVEPYCELDLEWAERLAARWQTGEALQ
jgi:hypothetical protein